MKIIGAIDIGSNAIRMICARLTPDRRIELVESVRTPLRLGLDVFKFGYLQEVTIINLVESINIFKRTLSQNKCEKIRAHGTGAWREADNADEVILRIERGSGIKVEAISGGKEAELLQRAVSRVVPLQVSSFLMADLGGGSVEIIVLRMEKLSLLNRSGWEPFDYSRSSTMLKRGNKNLELEPSLTFAISSPLNVQG